MAMQARAEATRRRILDSAIDLFDELGYGETGLADVLQRAGVSKGAFYYHFESKEALATAIIEDYRSRNAEAVRARLDLTTPLLDRIITASFTSAALIRQEKAASIGNQLMQSLGQVSPIAARIYAEWTRDFTANLATALESAGLRDGVDASDVAEAMWAGVLGCHLLSSAIGEDPHRRLARAWREMLRSTITEPQLGRCYELLDRSVTTRVRTA